MLLMLLDALNFCKVIDFPAAHFYLIIPLQRCEPVNIDFALRIQKKKFYIQMSISWGDGFTNYGINRIVTNGVQ